MTRAFQIAYVDLDTPVAEQEVAYYDRVLGATPAERGSDGRTYFSLGLDHHNITIKPAPDKRLTALGLRIDQETADDTVRSLRGLGLSAEKKATPGRACPSWWRSLLRGTHYTYCRRWPCLALAFVPRVLCLRVLDTSL